MLNPIGDENNNLPLSKFEKMLKTNYVLFFDTEEFEKIIHHYLDNGKMGLAKKAIHLGINQHPESVSIQLFQVETLVIDNKFEQAHKILDKLYELNQEDIDIYIQKANVLSRQEKHQLAVDVLEAAIKLSDNLDDHIDIMSILGMEYIYLSQFDKALGYFKNCLDYDPEDYIALNNAIYCFDFLNKPEDAIVFLNNYLNQQPYCEIAWYELGKQYNAIENYKKALTAFDFAVISDDTFIGAYIEKGKLLEKNKSYVTALEQYKIALALEDTPSAYMLFRMGKCFEALKTKGKGLEYYKKAIEQDPLFDKAWVVICMFYFKQKKFNKALYYIEKALEVDDNNLRFWKLYANTCRQLSLYEEAENGYRNLIELGNYELQVWLDRSDVLTLLGEYKASIDNLDLALDFYANQPEIEIRLAGLYFTINEFDKGYFYFTNSIQKNEDYLIIMQELYPSLLSHKPVYNLIKKYLS